VKKILFISLLALSNLTFSKEIQLFCKGQERDSLTGKNEIYKTYELTFDDVKKTVPIMTVGLIQGCFESDHFNSTKCVCKVTEKEVTCEGAYRGASGNLTGEQKFLLNRYTGMLMTNRTLTGKDSNSGKDFFIGTSGDFTCEPLSKRKF
jgi:hypothetical protein